MGLTVNTDSYNIMYEAFFLQHAMRSTHCQLTQLIK